MKLIAFICLFISISVHAGIIRQNVRTFSRSGDTPLIGNVTISPGTGITLTQTGQNVAISSTGSSGSGSASDTFNYIGGVTFSDDIDGIRIIDTSRTISSIFCAMRNSGSSLTTTVKANYGPALASFVAITVPANGSLNFNSIAPAIGLNANDYVSLAITGVANGAPEDLTCKVIY